MTRRGAALLVAALAVLGGAAWAAAGMPPRVEVAAADESDAASGKTTGNATPVTDEVPPCACLSAAPSALVVAGPEAESSPNAPATPPIRLMPLCVDVVDAETGLALSRARARAEVLDAFRSHCETEPQDALCGAVIEVEDAAGHDADVVVRPTTLDGYVAADSIERIQPVALDARSLRAVVPLRREARIEVRIQAPDDMPAGAKVEVTAWPTVGSAMGPAASLGGARFRVFGVPFFRGEPLLVTASARYPHCGAAWDGDWSGSLPAFADQEVAATIALAPAEEFVGPSHNGLWAVSGSGCGGRSAGPSGAVALRAFRRDGRPAARAHVSIERHYAPGKYFPFGCVTLDDAGCGRKENLPPGRLDASFYEPGVVPGDAAFDVRAGETTEVVLREPPGGAVDLVVVDADGSPLPFATVEVKQPSGVAWVDVGDDRTQRLDPFTDHLGRRSYGRLEPGDVKFSGRWASRRGEATVTVDAGRTTRGRLTLE